MARPGPDDSLTDPMTKSPKPFSLIRHANRWRGRRVGLYGGSFNPAHEGHIHVASEAIKRLELDAIWLMVSPGNPLKQKSEMAKRKRRKKSLRALVGNRPKMIVTDIEKKLGTLYSADTIRTLKQGMPQTDFIWIMGADNLASFHQWQEWQFIARTLPIAIFDRPGYSVAGLHGKFARQFGRYRLPYRDFPNAHAPAWTFVPIPRHSGSATNIRHHKGNEWWR